MESQNRNIVNLSKLENSYQLQVEDMCVEMVYASNNKSFYECMLNILKHKVER